MSAALSARLSSAARPLRLAGALAVALLMTVGLLAGPAAPSADAAVSASVGKKAVSIAASKKGAPYLRGAAGPSKFDCSGLTLWTYRKLGKTLPRTSAQQAKATQRITKSQARPGDLVFVHDRGRVYHVGIYSGNGRMWHSPKTGDVVKNAKIWSKSVYYGRVK